MGRWAQQTRRGGGGGLPSVSLNSVAYDSANNVILTFSLPVTVITGSHATDSSITVNGNGSTAAFAPAGKTCKVSINGAPAPGDVWQTNFQPPWLRNRLVQSTNGVVT